MSDSGDIDVYSTIAMVTSSGDDISNPSEFQSFSDSEIICPEDSVEVVISSDVAEETIVTTSYQTDIDNHQSTILHIPVDELALDTVDIVENGNFKTSLVETTIIIDNDQRDIDTDSIQQSYSREEDQLLKEIARRQKDKEYKREQRANPLYREKEKVKARERMKNRRKDPMYREIERQRDSERRRYVRRHNEEARQRERERDKEYKRGLRKSGKNLSNFSCDKKASPHDRFPGGEISPDNESDSLTTEDSCFSTLDSCSIQSIWSNRNVLDSNSNEESDTYLKLSSDQDAVPD